MEEAFYAVSSDRAEICRIAGGDHGALPTRTNDGTSHVASSFSDALHGASPNSGLLVVGEHGAIYTSKDCQTWTREESGTTVTLRGAYALSGFLGGQRVVVGDGGTVLVSRDGGPWIKVPLRTDADLYAVEYTGSFLAVGANGTVVRFY